MMMSHNEGKIVMLRPIAEALRDGREILCTDGQIWRVCYPKRFPRPLAEGGYDDKGETPSRAGDVWEYFRDEENAPGHSWSMVPTHFVKLDDLPQVSK